MANIDIVNLINRWYNTNPTMTINSAREAGNYVDALAELFKKANNIDKNPCLPPSISINGQNLNNWERYDVPCRSSSITMLYFATVQYLLSISNHFN